MIRENKTFVNEEVKDYLKSRLPFIVDKINEERFKANIKEACEQCGRNDFPQIFAIKKLDNLLKENLENKILILCDESGNGKKASEIFPKILPKNDQEIIIFIGPEGGFSKEELTKFYSLKNCFENIFLTKI